MLTYAQNRRSLTTRFTLLTKGNWNWQCTVVQVLWPHPIKFKIRRNCPNWHISFSCCSLFSCHLKVRAKGCCILEFYQREWVFSDRVLGNFDHLPLYEHFYSIAYIKYSGLLSNTLPLICPRSLFTPPKSLTNSIYLV